jgi:hypothetical protein
MILNPSHLPILVLFVLIVGNFEMLVTLHFILCLATRSHLLTREFIRTSIGNQNGSRMDLKFWKSMMPLKVQAGPFCSFETKQFLLFIWGEVVVKRIVDLLLAF